MDKGFEAKVMALVALTQRLDVPRTLLVRRMTLQDPESLKWATLHQLKLIFGVILEKAMERAGAEAVAAASDQMFDSMIPPGPDDSREEERWLLFDLSKPILAGFSATNTAETVTQAVMEELAADLEPIEVIETADFAHLFDETLARHFRRVLQVLAATGTRPYIPRPFYVAPQFAACFDSFIRAHVLPRIRGTRRIKELATTRNWADKTASARLISLAQSAADDNPISHYWNERWSIMHSDHIPSRKPAKAKEPEIIPAELWAVFNHDAQVNDYQPPDERDIPMLQRLLRLEAEVLSDQWLGLAQIYQQEFHPKSRDDQGRPNSFRDSLLRIIEKMDHHGGELLAIKAFFDLPKVDRQFLRQLIQSTGRGLSEQKRKVPVLIDFLDRLPK